MPFIFNAVKLCVVTIIGKLWTRAKEVCRALEYQKGRTRCVLKKYVSIENKQPKHELKGSAAAAPALEWPKNSHTDKYYISEEGMYELVFGSQQPKAKEFKKHCCNVMFLHVRQQLTNKIQEDNKKAITGHDNQIQVLEFTNEEHQQKVLRFNEEINSLLANRRVVRHGRFDNVLCFVKKNSREVNPYYVII